MVTISESTPSVTRTLTWRSTRIRYLSQTFFAHATPFFVLGFMSRWTPTNLLKFLPYGQRLFAAHGNCPVLTMRDCAGLRRYYAHDRMPGFGWKESRQPGLEREDE